MPRAYGRLFILQDVNSEGFLHSFFTMYADKLSETLCRAIGVVCISKTDGTSKLLERVDALLSPA